jgi:hypothetical protein
MWRAPGSALPADVAFVLDLGPRILRTRQKGSEVTVNADRLRFADTDSLRARVGGRPAYSASPDFSACAVANFEKRVRRGCPAFGNCIPLETPTLVGDTGIFETRAVWMTPPK